MEEKKERNLVAITTSGIYTMSPMKAEFHMAGTWETIKVRFSVDFGMSFDCFVDKTIFYKSITQADEEMSYILKFIAPNLLGKKYGQSNFKDYAEMLCKDINKELQRSWDEKNRIVLRGKLKMKKGDKYVEFENLIPKSGEFRNNYLATLYDTKSLWFTEWDLLNCEMPLRKIERQSVHIDSSNDSVNAFENLGNTPSVKAKEVVYDDLPF